MKVEMTSLSNIAISWFILTWCLTQQEAAEVNLDMVMDALDDQYVGCTEEMEKWAPQLLEEEMKINKDLRAQWRNATQRWNKIKSTIKDPKSKQLNDNHGIAIVAYTGKGIFLEFNKAVREFRKNTQNFHFKAFHYYLTRALQILRSGNCYTVYRGFEDKFKYSSGTVRFGQFASSSLQKKIADEYANGGTLFTIKTCMGVDIREYSFNQTEQEVLIPGNEVYQTIKVNDPNGNPRAIQLDSPQKGDSTFNCYHYSIKNLSALDNFSSSVIKSPVFFLLLSGLQLLLTLHTE